MEKDYFEISWKLLNDRGVYMKDIVECVIYLQKKYSEDIESHDIESIVNSVIRKREVQNTIMTGIGIDMAVESGIFLPIDVRELIACDDGLYGPDETLAIGITNLYGSIALTNFGYIDKEKPGIVGKLDSEGNITRCNTFLDDIVGAIAASAASKFAHNF